jgi:hypothetical protein
VLTAFRLSVHRVREAMNVQIAARWLYIAHSAAIGGDWLVGHRIKGAYSATPTLFANKSQRLGLGLLASAFT